MSNCGLSKKTAEHPPRKDDVLFRKKRVWGVSKKRLFLTKHAPPAMGVLFLEEGNTLQLSKVSYFT